MGTLNRRAFMGQSMGAVAAVTAERKAGSVSANDKVVVGVMGLGGRGSYLAERFAERPDTEIAYLCDVDSRRLARSREAVEKTKGRPVKLVQDFRRVLDDPGVHVLVNATPDHWHALGSIMACQAGKDVYVEKPMAHNIWEGRRMIEAARQYGRVVQVGMQSRSAPYVKAARDFVQSGKLGEVRVVRVFNMMKHPRNDQGPNQPEPNELDYDLWCGPAAKLPYNPTRFWLNFSEYSCGPIAGDAVHQLDLARSLMGDPPYPKTVSHLGGIYVLKDGRDLPDTQNATFHYDDFDLLFEAALWTPYKKKISMDIRNGDLFPDWPNCATRVELLGTEGMMYFGRHGGGWQVHDADNRVIAQCYGRPADNEHVDEFLRSVRSRALPNCDVEQGHYSSLLCHLANISWKVGNQTLALDAKTETFPGSPDADRFLKRKYREPWTL
jgi:predicted dehydrogenase